MSYSQEDGHEAGNDYKLVQESYLGNAWRVVVSSILLNRTTGEQVKNVIDLFFRQWPTPESVKEEDLSGMTDTIRTLGLMNRRAKMIARLASEWVACPPKSMEDLSKLHGIGWYALESYRIFVEGKMDFEPSDGVLRAYIERKRNEQ